MDSWLLLKSVAILAVAFFIALLLRRRSASERHILWLTALIAVLLLPAGRLFPIVGPIPAALSISATSSAALGGELAARRDWFMIVWAIGAAVCFVRVLTGAVRVLLIIRYSTQAYTAWGYKVRYTSALPTPVAWGIGHKLILLPVSATSWGDEGRDVVLRHEAAHLRRNDCLARLVAEIVCAFYWCNPLVWIAASRLRREQEHAADDEVVIGGVDCVTYAGHLVQLARADQAPLLAAGVVSESNLTIRVKAILDRRRQRRMTSRKMMAATVIAFLAIVCPLASMQVERQASRKIYKVSEGGIVPPKLLHKQEPHYTEAARDAKIQGQVVLTAVIEPEGRASDIKVTQGLDAGLDENAVRAVSTWSFQPAQKDGQPVPVFVEIKVNFRLL